MEAESDRRPNTPARSAAFVSFRNVAVFFSIFAIYMVYFEASKYSENPERFRTSRKELSSSSASPLQRSFDGSYQTKSYNYGKGPSTTAEIQESADEMDESDPNAEMDMDVFTDDHALKPKYARQGSCIQERWVVLTSRYPTQDLMLALQNQYKDSVCFCLVSAAANETVPEFPQELSKKIVYLSAKKQAKLPYAIIKYLPWGHISRKNVGYLYAIHHGAKWIYDAEGSQTLLHGIWDAKSFKGDVFEVDPFYHVFNPFPMLGAREAWPRGFPYEEIRNEKTWRVDGGGHGSNKRTVMLENDQIFILHAPAESYPDVDSVYRVGLNPYPLKHQNTQAVPFALRRGTLMPYNAETTVHYEQAFWGLMLPSTVTDRISDVWRSYMSQRLLWEVGGFLAVISAWAEGHAAGPTTPSADRKAITDDAALLTKPGLLAKYLAYEWNAKKGSDSVARLMKQMVIDMYDRGELEKRDIALVHAWDEDLQRINYTYPHVSPELPLLDFSASSVALGVQGKAGELHRWAQMTSIWERSKASIFLLSYDEPIGKEMCEMERVHCIFQPHSTWTAGRNLLARQMYHEEKSTNTLFKYWVFSDEDSNVVCDQAVCPGGGDRTGCCLDDLFDRILLKGNYEFPIVYLDPHQAHKIPGKWEENACPDGQFNSYHRMAVPFLLPYPTRLDKDSWWESQVLMSFILSGCLSGRHSVYPKGWYRIGNGNHMSYPRGRDRGREERAMAEEYQPWGAFPHPLQGYQDHQTCYQRIFEELAWNTLDNMGWTKDSSTRLCNELLFDRFEAFMSSNQTSSTNSP